jgi:putative FmdB family regulatory protein
MRRTGDGGGGTGRSRGYHRAVPLYEFECGRCGARFEELVRAGTDAVACRLCGAAETRRLYSPPGAPSKLVKTGGALRKQEQRNAQLHAKTKREFKSARERGRAKARGRGAGES